MQVLVLVLILHFRLREYWYWYWYRKPLACSIGIGIGIAKTWPLVLVLVLDSKDYGLEYWYWYLIFEISAQWSIIFSIPHFMIRRFWGHHVNQWVITSPTTPLPGLCRSGQISLCVTSLLLSKICPDVQRPGRGVVRLVMTHWQG